MGTFVQEDQKIGLISLAKEVENGNIKMNQAYNTAVKKLGYKGDIGSFIQMLKDEGLISRKEDRTPEETSKDVKGIGKQKKILIWGGVAIGAIVLINVLSKKSN